MGGMPPYGLTLITAPGAEPISTADAKTHLRITGSDDDTLVDRIVKKARQWCEAFTHRALIDQTWEMVMDGFPAGAILIAKPPLDSITSIKYVDTEGNTKTWTSTLYRVDTASEPGRVTPAWGETYPSVRTVTGSVQVRLKGGYGTAGSDVEDVAMNLISAMELVIGSMYEHREDIVVGTISSKIPRAAEILALPFLVREL